MLILALDIVWFFCYFTFYRVSLLSLIVEWFWVVWFPNTPSCDKGWFLGLVWNTMSCCQTVAFLQAHRWSLAGECILILLYCVVSYIIELVNPWTPNCCHMSATIKHPVREQVKPSFVIVIFDIRALLRSGLSVRVPGCQKLQMTA